MEAPGIGHNQPPPETETLKLRLNSYTSLLDDVNRLSRKRVPDEITCDKQAGAASDLIKAIKNASKEIETTFKREKQPYLNCCKVADTWKREQLQKLNSVTINISDVLLKWNRKKEEKERQRQLEIAQRAKKEAEAITDEAMEYINEGIDDTATELMKIASAKDKQAADIKDNAMNNVRGRSRGTHSTTSTSKTWVGELINRNDLDLEVIRGYLTTDALQKAINAAVRDGVRKINGVNIYEKRKINVR